MRTLSSWAKHHPVYARTIIIFSHIILIWMAASAGMQLSLSGVVLPLYSIYLLITVFFIVAACYPRQKAAKNYFKRKLCDVIVTACSFLLTVCFTNRLEQPFAFYQTANATTEIKPSPYKYEQAKRLLEQFNKGEKTKFTAKEKRIIKKEFQYQLVQYGKAKLTRDKAAADGAVLIILTCIAAVGLFLLVSSLACTLSCNGSEVAAWIVFILGTAAIVWGAVAIIRSITRKRKARESKASK